MSKKFTNIEIQGVKKEMNACTYDLAKRATTGELNKIIKLSIIEVPTSVPTWSEGESLEVNMIDAKGKVG